jgi:predicted RNA binding protein YcfA (HicA-like mRNA interferase family)
VTRLPVISGHDAVEALCKRGYEIDHQTDIHMILRRATVRNRRLTIPDHKELAKGTLRALIREAGLKVEEFTALL